jgi:hypothetical protein
MTIYVEPGFCLIVHCNNCAPFFASEGEDVPTIYPRRSEAVAAARKLAEVGLHAMVLPIGTLCGEPAPSETPFYVLCDHDTPESFAVHNSETGVRIAFTSEQTAIAEAKTLDATSIILKQTATVVRTKGHRTERLT